MNSKCSLGPYKSLHKHWENERKEEEFSRVIRTRMNATSTKAGQSEQGTPCLCPCVGKTEHAV